MKYFKSRWKAFGHAINGLIEGAREAHLKIHYVAALLVLLAGFYFKIDAVRWTVIIICIGLVISLELINSAIERICDKLAPHFDTDIKYIKDISSAAVLIVAIVAVAVGLIVFLPYLSL